MIASLCGTAAASAAGQVPETLPSPRPSPDNAAQAPTSAVPAPEAVAHGTPCGACCERGWDGHKLLRFFTYCPGPDGGCQCKCCGCRQPPLYAYFLHNCVEGNGPHGCDHGCGCASGHRFLPLFSGHGFGLGCGNCGCH
jgi:hypothetical protein